jgi:hypothetical protein
MAEPPPTPLIRVSSIPFPESYDLPEKPSAGGPAIDAFRQTGFVLGKDLGLFREGMGLQLKIVQDSSHSRFRKHPYAAIMGLWSRTFSTLADTCLLITRGSYQSCAPLVRSACEFVAAQQGLHSGEMELFTEWLAGHFVPKEEHKAFEFGLGRYFAGGVLADDAALRAVYRPASELGRPSFGATTLLIGPESNNRRLALAFADSSFHVGWAELTLGWLLSLCERQLAFATHAKGTFAIHDDTHAAYLSFSRRVEQSLTRSDRCRVEEIEEGGYKRYLAHNVRRAAAGAPKRLLL